MYLLVYTIACLCPVTVVAFNLQLSVGVRLHVMKWLCECRTSYQEHMTNDKERVCMRQFSQLSTKRKKGCDATNKGSCCACLVCYICRVCHSASGSRNYIGITIDSDNNSSDNHNNLNNLCQFQLMMS